MTWCKLAALPSFGGVCVCVCELRVSYLAGKAHFCFGHEHGLVPAHSLTRPSGSEG